MAGDDDNNNNCVDARGTFLVSFPVALRDYPQAVDGRTASVALTKGFD